MKKVLGFRDKTEGRRAMLTRSNRDSVMRLLERELVSKICYQKLDLHQTGSTLVNLINKNLCKGNQFSVERNGGVLVHKKNHQSVVMARFS